MAVFLQHGNDSTPQTDIDLPVSTASLNWQWSKQAVSLFYQPIFILSPPIPLRLYTLPYLSNPPFLIFDIRAPGGWDQCGLDPSNSSNLEQLPYNPHRIQIRLLEVMQIVIRNWITIRICPSLFICLCIKDEWLCCRWL